MADLTENLERLVLENKLTRAHREIKIFLSTETHITQKLFELIQKVFELTSESDTDLIISFLNISLNSKINISKFLAFRLNQVDEDEFYFIYPIAKKFYIENGMLSHLEETFNRYKRALLKNKSYTKLLEEIDDIEGYGVDVSISEREKSLCYYGLKDISYFEEKYEKSLLRRGRTALRDVHINFEDPFWRKQSFIMKEKVIRSAYGHTIESKKAFLKSIYELILVESEVESCLSLLLTYAVEMGHKELSKELVSLLKNKFNGDEASLEERVRELRPITRGVFDEIDLADDLFGGEISEKDITIRRLVNQINILKDERDLEGATKLLEKLKKLDKEHTLIKELEEKEHKVKGSKRAKVKKTISEVEQELLNELSIYSKVEENELVEEESYLKIYTKKVIDLMPIEELEAQYRALIYSYNTLGFYENSLLIIERLLNEVEFEVGLQIEMEFLKAEIMRMSQNYYGALNCVEKCIEEKAMTNKEKVSFYYLKGEILREVGRGTDALKAYAIVFSLDKKYRMVGYRLKEIE